MRKLNDFRKDVLTEENESSYKELFTPLNIGSLTIPNRIVMSPMASHFADSDGRVTEQLIKWYEERAKGGVGFIITESNYVRKDGRGGLDRLGLHCDENIEGAKQLVKSVHKYGSKICAQLHHAGRLAPHEAIGTYPISPSTTHYFAKGNFPMVGSVSRELGVKEIKELITSFGNAARRAKEAGFDAVQVHAAHGYLINQFISPRTNLREDEYGGSLKNRCRFLIEVIEQIRQEVGQDFPVLLRLSAEEELPEGYTIDYILEVIHLIKDMVEAIELSSGTHESFEWIIQPKSIERNCYTTYTKLVKQEVSIPVGVVGRIKTPQDAEKILKDKKADFIILGRALIADPMFASKIKNNSVNEIRECIACNRCYDEVYKKDGSIRCAVNPFAGRESTLKVLPILTKKRVLIVGGGCGGLQAAIIAKKRGHDVVLYEKNGFLGGQAILASRNPMDPEIGSVAKNLIYEIESLGIEYHLNVEVDEDLIRSEQPDHVILAAGAIPKSTNVPGGKFPHVKTVFDILKGDIPKGKSAVVIGGGLNGACVAEFLFHKHINSTILKKSIAISNKAGFTIQKEHTYSLNKFGIPIIVDCDILEIKSDKVIYKQFGAEREIFADMVVLASGMMPNNSLEKKLLKLDIPVTSVGDCKQPREVFEAIHEGFEAGNLL